MTRYIVQTNTMVDGWTNCWSENDKPATFPSRWAAEREIQAMLASLPDYMRQHYSREDYRIVKAHKE